MNKKNADRGPLVASRLSAALARMRELHPDMTVLQSMYFFTIAANPGITQRQLYEQLGVTDTHASRAVAMLGEYGSRNVPPLNLLRSEVNPDDRREKRSYLSAKGERLLRDIVRDLE